MTMKNSNDIIRNQTRDLPTCSAVPQPTVPPRTPFSEWVRTQYVCVFHRVLLHVSPSRMHSPQILPYAVLITAYSKSKSKALGSTQKVQCAHTVSYKSLKWFKICNNRTGRNTRTHSMRSHSLLLSFEKMKTRPKPYLTLFYKVLTMIHLLCNYIMLWMQA